MAYCSSTPLMMLQSNGWKIRRWKRSRNEMKCAGRCVHSSACSYIISSLVVPVDFSSRFDENRVVQLSFHIRKSETIANLLRVGHIYRRWLALISYFLVWLPLACMPDERKNKPCLLLQELVQLQLWMLKKTYCWEYFFEFLKVQWLHFTDEMDIFIIAGINFLRILFSKNY